MTVLPRHVLGFCATLALASCISAPPAPLDPAKSAARLAALSLDEPAVTAALAKAQIGRRWDLDALTVAAWTLRPDIRVATLDVAAANAAARTAGELPNPTLSLDPGYLFDNASGNLSPWTIATAVGFTIELGHKRAIRTAQAQAEVETRRWHLAETLWKARQEVRKAVVTRQLAQTALTLAERELALRQSFSDWVENEFRFGAAAQPDRLTAAISLAQARSAVRTAHDDLTGAEAALATALGITADKLPRDSVIPLTADMLPEPASFEEATLRDDALLNRLGVRHALADYDVAEQGLRLAVARQYPDIAFGPGYVYDKGDQGVTLNVGFTLPLFHGSGAAIAEAMSTRTKAAAVFEGEQQQALAALDAALGLYQSAAAARRDTRASEAAALRNGGATDRRLRMGGADRGDVVAAELLIVTAQRASLDATRAAFDALGALEDAIQRPLWPTSSLGLQRPDEQQAAR